METIKESLKENIRRVALRNLEKEPILIHEKQHLAELYAELGPARDNYRAIGGKIDQCRLRKIFYYALFKNQFFLIIDDESNDTSPEMIDILLQTAASDLERKTEVCEIQLLLL